jgi:ribonucleoside-diphosphate reductase alpha chain
VFAISFVRNVLSGKELLEINSVFENAAKYNKFYSTKLMMRIAKNGSVKKIKQVPKEFRKIFVTALDIDPIWHVRMQAVFQKYTDNAVSKTVNLPEKAKVNDILKIYELAYKLKCKGITVFRYGSKGEQVLSFGKKFTKAESEYAGGCPAKVCHI